MLVKYHFNFEANSALFRDEGQCNLAQKKPCSSAECYWCHLLDITRNYKEPYRLNTGL